MTTATLTSNGIPIPYTPHYFDSLKVTEPSVDATRLRDAYSADGYVMLRGALPAASVWALREAYLSSFASGFCKNGDARRGDFSGAMPTNIPSHGFSGHPAHAFVRSEAFLAFADQPALKNLAEIFIGAPSERIRRTPLRHFIPGRKIASRAHMDKTYIDDIVADVVTIWVPLGDAPLESGGLLYLENSHQDPSLERRIRESAPMDRANDQRPLSHDLKWVADATRRRWLAADYQAGDVVVHSPSIVHASTDPGNTDYMRISTDIRFRSMQGPTDPRWSSDWSADDGY